MPELGLGNQLVANGEHTTATRVVASKFKTDLD